MDLAQFAHGLEKIIASREGKYLVRRRKESYYHNWAIPNSACFTLLAPQNVFYEQDFFDATTLSQVFQASDKIECLQAIVNLNDNWDGNGAIKPDQTVINNSESFLSALPKYLLNALKTDDITPTPYGTIVFDWQNEQGLISVEIGEKYIGFFSEFSDGTSISLDRLEFDRNDLPAELLSAYKKVYS